MKFGLMVSMNLGTVLHNLCLEIQSQHRLFIDAIKTVIFMCLRVIEFCLDMNKVTVRMCLRTAYIYRPTTTIKKKML